MRPTDDGGTHAVPTGRPQLVNIAEAFVDAPARRHPSSVALVDRGSHVTYARLSDLTRRAGNVLRDLGCARGDRVLVCLPDSIELVTAIFGAARIGCVGVPVSPAASQADLDAYLKGTEPRLVIAHESALDNVTRALAGSDRPVLVVGRGVGGKNVHAWSPRIDTARTALQTVPTLGNEPVLLLHTSGSTGRQKPAVHVHQSLIAASRSVGREVFDLQRSDRVLSTARLFFSFGLGFGLYLPLSAGATVVLNPSNDLDQLANTIRQAQPTILCAVPSLLRALLRAATLLRPDLSSLRFIVSAGEALPPAMFDEYQERFGVEVLDGIGSTEMLTHFITNRPGRARRGSCGVVVPGCDARLVDEHGDQVPVGDVGMLLIRGRTAFAGYWRQPATTAGVRRGDWLVTGDNMTCDADGFYAYCGRNDDMVKVWGLWVLPQDVEAVLCGHPDVDAGVVTARQDPSGMTRLVAYVVARSGATPGRSQLYRYLADRLPAHMVPADVVIVPEIPRTPTGKLRRPALPAPQWTALSNPAPPGDPEAARPMRT